MRPNLVQRREFTVRLPIPLDEMLKERSKVTGVSKSAHVALAVRQYLAGEVTR